MQRQEKPAPAGDDDVRFDPIVVLRSIVKHIGVAGHGTRQALLGQISGHGSTVTREIITWLGLDPDEVVGACTECGGTDSYGDCGCLGSGVEAVRRVMG